MNVARINMAHIDPCNMRDPFRNVIEANNQYIVMEDFDIPISIMMDLKGPEIRTGKIDSVKFKFYRLFLSRYINHSNRNNFFFF